MADPLAEAAALFAAAGKIDVPLLLIEAAAGLRDADQRRRFVDATTARVIERARKMSSPKSRLWLVLEDQMAEALDDLFRQRVRRKCRMEL